MKKNVRDEHIEREKKTELWLLKNYESRMHMKNLSADWF